MPREVLHDILEATRSLPSSANTQPWQIIVTQGATRDRLVEKMLQKFDAGDDGEAQYKNRPGNMVDRMQKACDDYGRQFYEEHFGVSRGDKAGRREKYRPNYEFWGAPVHLILCAPYQQAVVEGVDGIPLDMGTLLTAMCLGAHSHGMGAKPQFSVAKYHDVCREVLGKELPDDMFVVCGLSIGWPVDGRDPRIQPDFFPTRLGVDETTRWEACDSKWLSAAEGAGGDGGPHTLLQLIHSRHGSHSLDPTRPVSKDIVAAILDAARNVPSTNNSQPWCISVIQVTLPTPWLCQPITPAYQEVRQAKHEPWQGETIFSSIHGSELVRPGEPRAQNPAPIDSPFQPRLRYIFLCGRLACWLLVLKLGAQRCA